MNIQDALLSMTIFPIPVNVILKICIDRGLNYAAIYTSSIGTSQEFKLATADVYYWLYTSPDIKEQQISITQADRDNFLYMANVIYNEFEDPKFTGTVYGFIGEDFNG